MPHSSCRWLRTACQRALAEHVAQPVGLAQPGGGAEGMADRDRAPEHRGGVMVDRVVSEGDEVVAGQSEK